MILKLRMPRYIEFILGVFLVIVLVSRYSASPKMPSKFLLEHVLTNRPLFVMANIFLYLVAARLIAGPPKDYTRYFYSLLLKLRGSRS